jgi:hypothetical protein
MPTLTSFGNSSGGNPVTGYFKAPVNNALLDPLQGFDADVWVVDQATGAINMIGRFNSLQLTVRDSTEPYLEFNQRAPRYLNGEVQIGWVLERGMVDTRLLQSVFGFNTLSREMRFNRSPRMQITFDLNAPELQQVSGNRTSENNNGELIFGQGMFSQRQAVGQYRLTFCKPDTLTIGMMAGRSVIATRIEGLAEGIEFIDDSLLWPGISLDATSGTSNFVRGSQAAVAASQASNPLGLSWGSGGAQAGPTI